MTAKKFSSTRSRSATRSASESVATVAAFMERVGPAPDSDMFMDADPGNAEPVTVEYEHALAGPQKKVLRPGQRLTLAPVISRRWKMTAPNWE